MPVNIVNTEHFTELRQSYGYYVDKTGFLLQFFKDPTDATRFRSPSSVTLFTRPRRFGKTLFMSMLASFFDVTKSSRDLFTGLKVAENEVLCKEWMNKYPVVSLTLKGIEKPTFERALARIHVPIRTFCSQHKYLLTCENVSDEDKDYIRQYLGSKTDEDTLELALQVLTRALSCYYDKQTIVLIDEYDVPVAKAAERGYYDEMILFMRGFLSNALKTNDYLKFAILTGALRITKESIFTGLNNLDCFDIANPRYADVFGFTQCEVDQLLSDAGLEEKRETLREWYDGYYFGDRSDIYCPWSIMKYLADVQSVPKGKPKAYWVGTSGNELPRDFARRLPAEEDVQGKIAALLGGNAIAVKLNPNMNYVDILKNANNFWTLLYLTGYLTLTSNAELYEGEKNARDSLLVIPNREVREVFQDEMEAWFANILPVNRQNALYRALWAQDIQGLEEQLTALLVGTSFHDAKESYYHGVMYGVLAMRYGDTISNGESGFGLYDIVVEDMGNERAAVLEFKCASSAEQMDASVQKALGQIRRNDYDVRLQARGCKTILHVGIAFCQKSARVGFEVA